MKKKHFVLASALLALLMGGASCSSEQEYLAGSPDTPAPDASNGIRIVVHTPAPDDIIMSRVLHDTPEYTVNKLGVYLFLADNTSGTADADYKLAYQKTDLTTSADGDQFTDNGNGSLSYTLPIQAAWLGKSAKIALVANDAVANLTVDNITLEAFKQSVATNKLEADDQSADIISGSIYASDASGATGLPMTAMAKADGNSDAFNITPLGADLTASLQRIMARIDVCNKTPNLTITGMKVTHAAAQGYLFPQETTAAPAETYYTLMPTSGYDSQLTGDGIKFNAEPDADNTLKHVFYLYEQVNADAGAAQVVIDYNLKIGAVTKEGTVSVPLKTAEDAYINTTRNNLYTIVLGSGDPIQDGVLVTTLTVNNWEETTNISGELQPGNGDESTIPGKAKDLNQLAVGDYYMMDGTVRDKDDILPAAYPYVIGVVFQTYKAAPDRFGVAEKTALNYNVHGLVMAVKNASADKLKWKDDTTAESGLDNNNTTALGYKDVSGLANYNQVAENDPGFTHHPAFKAVADFESSVPAPVSSTGWFLPSIGQWWDLVENMGGFYEQMIKYRNMSTAGLWMNYRTGTDSGTQVYMPNVEAGAAQNNVNKYLTPLSQYADLIVGATESAREYSSSSQFDVAHYFGPDFSNSCFVVSDNSKTSPYYVRPFLAF